MSENVNVEVVEAPNPRRAGGRMGHAETGQVYRGNLDKLIARIERDGGVDLRQYRRPYIERRLAARLRALGMHTYRQYSEYLGTHPEEYASMLDTLTVNVTDFFRDPPVYEKFRHAVLPELIESKAKSRHRMLRVWSAGCSSGEEPYSIAMLVMDALAQRGEKFLLSIHATDLDPKVLAFAKAAEYPLSAIQKVPHRLRVRYLDVHDETFSVKPEVTEHVRFRPLNLFEDKPINIVDVIFCRNVFIYFSREQQEKVLGRFWDSLSRGGYLVLGRSEKMHPGFASRFELVSGRERIYRKPSSP